MAKSFFFFLLLTSVSLNVYLLNSEVKPSKTVNTKITEIKYRDKITSIKSSIKKELSQSAPKNLQPIKKMTIVDSKAKEAEEAEAFYQAAKRKRQSLVKSFFNNSNYNTPSQFEEYLQLSDEYEEAMAQIYDNKEPYINSHGVPIFWNTIEDDMLRGQISAEYIQKLKSELGEEGYLELQSFKDVQNRKAFKENTLENIFYF